MQRVVIIAENMVGEGGNPHSNLLLAGALVAVPDNDGVPTIIMEVSEE